MGWAGLAGRVGRPGLVGDVDVVLVNGAVVDVGGGVEPGTRAETSTTWATEMLPSGIVASLTTL